MLEKEYAIVAMRDILARALGAVEVYGMILGEPPVSTGLAFGEPVGQGWNWEFAQMTRKEQVEWLLHLFEVLVEHG